MTRDLLEGGGNLEPSSEAVHSYLSAIQSTVNRMATNSASCKTWCITAVSALLVAGVDKGHVEVVRVLLVPVVIFGFLDAYYLGLERSSGNGTTILLRAWP